MNEEDVIIEATQIATGDDDGDEVESAGKSPAQLWAEADGVRDKGGVLFAVLAWILIFAVPIGLLIWLVLTVV